MIVRRQKVQKEFIFQDAFSYYEKGLCHIWKDETAKQREAKIDLDQRNTLTEAGHKSVQELENRIARLGLRNKPGVKPVQKYTDARGAAVRNGKGGIDWYRYQQEILKKKLLPFAKAHTLAYPDTLVQEDGAPVHKSRHNQPFFSLAKVAQLIWPGNSLDLNAIEPCWWYMKLQTTRKGCATSKKDLTIQWEKCWKELPQARIQGWVDRIAIHIEAIIKCKGGNEYMESSADISWRKRQEKGLDLEDLVLAT